MSALICSSKAKVEFNGKTLSSGEVKVEFTEKPLPSEGRPPYVLSYAIANEHKIWVPKSDWRSIHESSRSHVIFGDREYMINPSTKCDRLVRHSLYLYSFDVLYSPVCPAEEFTVTFHWDDRRFEKSFGRVKRQIQNTGRAFRELEKASEAAATAAGGFAIPADFAARINEMLKPKPLPREVVCATQSQLNAVARYPEIPRSPAYGARICNRK